MRAHTQKCANAALPCCFCCTCQQEQWTRSLVSASDTHTHPPTHTHTHTHTAAPLYLVVSWPYIVLFPWQNWNIHNSIIHTSQHVGLGAPVWALDQNLPFIQYTHIQTHTGTHITVWALCMATDVGWWHPEGFETLISCLCYVWKSTQFRLWQFFGKAYEEK